MSFRSLLEPLAIIGAITGSLIAPIGYYAYGTYNTRPITIDSKFTKVFDGRTSYMVSDKDNNIYRINRSFYYWRFNNVETWNLLKENKQYTVGSYGWRAPFWGMYPNIIDVKKEKDSIPSGVKLEQL